MRSWLLLVLANGMWAMQFTCIKLVQDQAGPLFTVWGPMALAALLLYPVVRGERPSLRPERRDLLRFLALAALGIFPGQVIVTWGTRMSLASNAALIVLTLPVSTAVLAAMLLGERMTARRYVSFALAMAGVLLCSGLDSGTLDFGMGYLAGNLLILAGTLGSAFYNSYSKRVLERFSPIATLFYSYVAMLAITAPLLVLTEPDSLRRLAAYSSRTWTGMILLTVFHNYLSMVLFLKALRRLDAIQAGLCNYLVTVFGLPVAALWLGERLSPVAVAGGLLVLLGTVLVTTRESSRGGAAGLVGGGGR